jgi:hypothetical protein
MTTTVTTSRPVPSWDLTSLTPSRDSRTSLESNGYSLGISAMNRTASFLDSFKEFYSLTLVVDADVQRPVSSDYSPWAKASVWLRGVGRNSEGKVVQNDHELAALSSNSYGNREAVDDVRGKLDSLVKTDSPLSRWWHGLLTQTAVASDAAKEQGRTDLILSLIEEERERLKTERYENPRKGQTTKVVRGRKVPVGTEGKLIWVGQTKFGKRVGFKDASETVYWTAWGNIEFTDPVDEAAVLANAKKRYAETYASVFGAPRT